MDWLRQLAGEEEQSPIQDVEAATEELQEQSESPQATIEETPEQAEITGGFEDVEHEMSETPAASKEEEIEKTEIPGAFTEDESILEETETEELEDLPDWLKGVDEEKSTEEPIQEFKLDETPQVPSPLEMEPDWLSEIGSEEMPEEVTQQPSSESSEEPITETSPSYEMLKHAQEALEAHNIERALGHYDQLIQQGQFVEETIHDLRDALYRYPIDVAIWQLLGDAYMKSNHLQDALDAYTKAEELLR